MTKFKMMVGLFLIFALLTAYTCEAKIFKEDLEIAQRRSYRRVHPGSVSPKSGTIQTRDAREKMQAEAAEAERVKAEEALEAAEAEKDKEEPEEKPPLVDGKPTKIYYRISVDDKLFIGVWRVRDLSMEVIVGPDGYISFPLIGDLFAYGKTLSELDAELTEKLKEYVVDPQVSVMVREFAGDNVIVLGEIRSPGIYKFVKRTKIVNVIALAGGFTDRARVVGVVVVREPEDPRQEEPDLIVVNAKEILKGKLRNMEIRPNDIVYVSRTFVSNIKEFYNDWVSPLLGTVADTAIDYETFMALKRARRH